MNPISCTDNRGNEARRTTGWATYLKRRLPLWTRHAGIKDSDIVIAELWRGLQDEGLGDESVMCIKLWA